MAGVAKFLSNSTTIDFNEDAPYSHFKQASSLRCDYACIRNSAAQIPTKYRVTVFSHLLYLCVGSVG